MANVKITALNSIIPAPADVLPVVDVSANVTSKATVANILKNAGDGSAAVPSHSFASDSDTGIFRAGANRLALTTSGTQKVELTAAGNLLIGGTLPSAPNITLASDGSTTLAGNLNVGSLNTGATGVSGSLLQNNGTLRLQKANGNETFSIFNGTTKNVSITADGSSVFKGTLDVGSLNTAATGVSGARLSTSGTINVQRTAATSSNGQFYAGWKGTDRTFFVSTNGGIKINGTTGNSTNPKITLNGDGSATFKTLEVGTDSNTEGQVVASFYGGSGAAARGLEIKLGTTNSVDNALVTLDAKQASAGQLALATKGVERLRIDNSGNIRTGNTLPDNPTIRLNADGSAIFNGNITNNKNQTVDFSTRATLKSTSGFVFDNTNATSAICWPGTTTNASKYIYWDHFGAGQAFHVGAVNSSNVKTDAFSVSLQGDGQFAGNVDAGAQDVSNSSAAGAKIFPQGAFLAQRPSGNANSIYIGYQGTTRTVDIKADGNATFASDIISGDNPALSTNNEGIVLRSRGTVTVNRPSALAIWQGFQTGTSAATSVINADGSAQFEGNVDVGAVKAAGSSGGVDSITAGTTSDPKFFVVRGNGTVLGSSSGAASTSNYAYRLNASGSAQFAGSVSIGGTAAQNTIGAYETGVFTPQVVGSTTAGTLTFGTNGIAGKYTRVGKTCHIEIYIDITNLGGAAGNYRINNLPFNANNTGFGNGFMRMFCTVADLTAAAYTTNNANYLFIKGPTGAQQAIRTGKVTVNGSYMIM